MIYKYAVERIGAAMPLGAKILHVGEQNGQITVWADVDPHAGLVLRKIRIVLTGDRVPNGCGVEHHIGTVFIDGYIYHIFDDPERMPRGHH